MSDSAMLLAERPLPRCFACHLLSVDAGWLGRSAGVSDGVADRNPDDHRQHVSLQPSHKVEVTPRVQQRTFEVRTYRFVPQRPDHDRRQEVSLRSSQRSLPELVDRCQEQLPGALGQRWVGDDLGEVRDGRPRERGLGGEGRPDCPEPSVRPTGRWSGQAADVADVPVRQCRPLAHRPHRAEQGVKLLVVLGGDADECCGDAGEGELGHVDALERGLEEGRAQTGAVPDDPVVDEVECETRGCREQSSEWDVGVSDVAESARPPFEPTRPCR